MKLIVLDSEAVDALSSTTSAKHRRALAYIEADRGNRRRRPAGGSLVVPSTVRIEAGWDRTRPAAAVINRLGITDHHLTEVSTNVAAGLRRDLSVSPADAHIGAVVAGCRDADVIVITSDPDDIQKVAGTAPVRICPI